MRKKLSHIILCFVCLWFPIQALIVATHLVYETEDERTFDIAYAALILLAHTSSAATAFLARSLLPTGHPAGAPPSYLRRWRYYRKKVLDFIGCCDVTSQHGGRRLADGFSEVNVVLNEDGIETWSMQSAPSQATQATSLERTDSYRAETNSNILRSNSGHLLPPSDSTYITTSAT